MASGVGCADLLLNEAGRGREKHVGSGRCHMDEIDLLRRNLCLLDRLECRFRRHVASVFVLIGNPTLLDTGSRSDPVVAGINHAREVCISQNFVGHIAARTDD